MVVTTAGKTVEKCVAEESRLKVRVHYNLICRYHSAVCFDRRSFRCGAGWAEGGESAAGGGGEGAAGDGSERAGAVVRRRAGLMELQEVSSRCLLVVHSFLEIKLWWGLL